MKSKKQGGERRHFRGYDDPYASGGGMTKGAEVSLNHGQANACLDQKVFQQIMMLPANEAIQIPLSGMAREWATGGNAEGSRGFK